MGTRGALGFVYGTEEKVTYNHFDSYPSGLGVDVLAWLRSADLATVAEQVKNLRLVNEDDIPTEDDKRHLLDMGVVDTGVGRQSTDDWYCLLRGTQGNPAAILAAGVMSDGSKFPASSLWCEYAYVVDLDRAVFQAYKGFQKAPHNLGRFADRPDPTEVKEGYWPVALVAEWSLEHLPNDDDFCATVDPPEDDE